MGLFANTDKKLAEIRKEGGTFTVDHNMFSTMTEDEAKRFMGRIPKTTNEPITYLDDSNTSATVDWRAKGAVNPVQNQGQCGSCWAFSTTAAIEGAHFIATGNLLKLSESEFVDCDGTDAGCNGGLEADAMKWAESNSIVLESDYPYFARTRSCNVDYSLGQVNVTSINRVTPQSIPQLQASIDQGPTCVAVDAANMYFQGYSGGILNTTKCGQDLDHAVTAVGYGTENGQLYYIVRNSWGPNWGESGYIRIAAIKGDGVCGIQLDSVRPTSG